MTTSGAAPWLRTAVFADYGGHAQKTNYGGRGVVDPRTDIDAGQIQRIAADLACLVRVAPFATVSCDGASSPVVTSAAVGPVATVARNYAGGSPPAGMPTVTHTATGTFRIAFSSSYTDASGDEQDFTPFVVAGSISDTTESAVSAYVDDATGDVVVLTWGSSGSAGVLADDVAWTIEVW